MRARSTLGADIVNDIARCAAGRARRGRRASDCGVCLMHMQGEPRSMQSRRLRRRRRRGRPFLAERACRAARAASRRAHRARPGHRLRQDVAHNLALLRASASCWRWATRCWSAGRASRRWARSPGGRSASGWSASVAAALAAVQRGRASCGCTTSRATVDALKVWRRRLPA
jgi:dihydropteroate synthase